MSVHTDKRRSGTSCEVFWGSHGCCLEPGHDGPHLCTCATEAPEEGVDVGQPPYYGEATRFYGADAERLGLPLVSAP
jgi:hypothetical protein